MELGPTTYRELKLYIIEDLKWTNGKVKRALMTRLLFESGFKFTFWLRITRFFYLRGGYFYLIPRIILKHYSYKYNYDISYRAQIGPGLTISHHGYIVVTSDTVLGRNCTLRPGVVFGKKLTEDSHGCVVGDNVDFGVGSKMIGKIQIGNDVIIGANAVITKNVPSKCVVAGVPGKVIKELK